MNTDNSCRGALPQMPPSPQPHEHYIKVDSISTSPLYNNNTAVKQFIQSGAGCPSPKASCGLVYRTDKYSLKSSHWLLAVNMSRIAPKV